VKVDSAALKITASLRVNSLLSLLIKDPGNLDILDETITSLREFRKVNIELDIWRAQNMFFELFKKCYEEMNKRAEENNEDAVKWIEKFIILEGHLQVSVL
jgi:hypothetical protein